MKNHFEARAINYRIRQDELSVLYFSFRRQRVVCAALVDEVREYASVDLGDAEQRN